jgi:hypothetical protein
MPHGLLPAWTTTDRNHNRRNDDPAVPNLPAYEGSPEVIHVTINDGDVDGEATTLPWFAHGCPDAYDADTDMTVAGALTACPTCLHMWLDYTPLRNDAGQLIITTV